MIVLANKYDLQPVASISEIIEALNLKDLPSFEVIPVSCKTGYGIVKAFMKMYYKLTGKQLTQKTNLRAITVFDQGGIPLTSSSNEDILQGGLFTAIHNFVRESFNKELDQLKMGGHLIVFKRSKHLMGSIIVNDNDNINVVKIIT